MHGKIQTVKGPLDPEKLSVTMIHEHLLWDQVSSWWEGEPEEASLKELAYRKVSPEIRGQLYYRTFISVDNLQQRNVDVATEEAMWLKRAGGDSIVDVTSIGLGRDPRALLAISQVTGLNVVMGAGYYIGKCHSAEVRAKTKEEITETIVREFAEGVKETGIRPGVIGEIGIPLFGTDEQEMKMLKAAAAAQKQVGCALYIHPPFFEARGNDILDVVEQEGADLTKVVLCHCDATFEQPDYHASIAKRGAFIAFDQFGHEIMAFEGKFLPRDSDRIRGILNQLERGNLKNLLISNDVCFKTCLVRMGGWGYGHVLRDIVPLLRVAGVCDSEVKTMFIENPKRLLAF
jgi:phosphotriesterase-related protein